MASPGEVSPKTPAQRTTDLLRDKAPKVTPMADKVPGTAASNIRASPPGYQGSSTKARLKLLNLGRPRYALEMLRGDLEVLYLPGLSSPPAL